MWESTDYKHMISDNELHFDGVYARRPAVIRPAQLQPTPTIRSFKPFCSLGHNEMKMTPATYHPTHNRTLPPPDQEAKNILMRHIYQHPEEKSRTKRPAPEHSMPEHGSKQLRPSAGSN